MVMALDWSLYSQWVHVDRMEVIRSYQVYYNRDTAQICHKEKESDDN